MKTTVRHILTALLGLVLVGPAAAQTTATLIETGVFSTNPSRASIGNLGMHAAGARFHIDQAVDVVRVGGGIHIIHPTITASIVRLDGPGDLPGTPVAADRVVASTTLASAGNFDPAANLNAVDLRVPLAVRLEPGDYFLAFHDTMAAPGPAAMPYTTPIGSPSIFTWLANGPGSTSGSWTPSPMALRFVIEVAAAPAPLPAGTLLETGAFSTNPSRASIGNVGMHAAGARFHIDQAVDVTRVGGGIHIIHPTITASIVRLDGPNDLPGHPVAADRVVASTTLASAGNFDPAANLNAVDLRVPLAVRLEPGDYFLVFHDTMAAPGPAAMPYTTPIGSPSIFTWLANGPGSTSGSWTQAPMALRFVIEVAIPPTDPPPSDPPPSDPPPADPPTPAAPGATQASLDAFRADAAGQSAALLQAVATTQAAVAQLGVAVSTRASEASVNAVASAVTALAATVAQEETLLALSGSVGNIANDTRVAVESAMSSVGSQLESAVHDAIHAAMESALAHQDVQVLRRAIEQALSDGKPRVSFFLPSAVGGSFELVRQVVDELIIAAQTAGIDAAKATIRFAKGDVAAAAGDFRAAYDWYAKAYDLLR